MKSLFKNLMLVAVAAMAFTSCNKENFNDNLVQDNSVTMTFVADAPESRTSVSIDGETAKFSWSAGDKVGFYYVDVEGTGNKKQGSNEAKISGSTATFSASFDELEGATAYNVGAFYPSESWVGHSETAPFNNVKVKIASGQNLTDGTFDPKADLMMSKPFMGIALSSDNTKTLQFSRIAAIGKMNLKLDGMENGEVIESVKFGFAEGTHFNGPVSIDLENSSYTLGTTGTSNAVTLTGELVATEDRTAIFFTCFPGEYSGEYTIEVKTDKAKYSKSDNITNALVFTAGNVLNFNATVGNREVEKVEAGQVVDELNRATTGRDKNAGYDDWSGKTDKSGAVYAGNSAGSNDAIQLRSKESNSGIVTTTSGGKVRKIVVTWQTATTSGRTLDIYGKNTAYSAATDLYSSSTQGTKLGSIIYGTSTELTIEGDYAYIGLRSSSGAMYITSIEITWETDGESGGDEPETPAEPVKLTMSELTTSKTSNSISVSWTAVPGAQNYAVSLNNGPTTTVAGTTHTFTDLAASTSYTVSVVAVGDGVNYTNSEPATTSVTTSAEQTGGETESVTATLSFANKAQRTSFSTSQQVWEQNGIKLTNNKASSSNNVADFAKPVRFYAGSEIIVDVPEGGEISEIVFDCNSSSYATAMKNSIGTVSGATVTVNSDKVTVEFSTRVDSFTIAKLTAQVRMDSVTVTYWN